MQSGTLNYVPDAIRIPWDMSVGRPRSDNLRSGTVKLSVAAGYLLEQRRLMLLLKRLTSGVFGPN